MYDNTKFNLAFDAWLSDETQQKKGGKAYVRDIVASFNQYVKQTGIMKKGPGIVVIGRRLKELGFEKALIRGSTFWLGLEITGEVIPDMNDPVTLRRAAEREQVAESVLRERYRRMERDADIQRRVTARRIEREGNKQVPESEQPPAGETHE